MDTLGVAAGMIGIIGLFVIFRFQSLDAYVDHRKDILRNLLNTEVKADPRLAVAIQRVGKGPFAGIYSTRLSEAKNVAVDQFCEDILSLRQRRAKTVGGGMGTMALWLI